MPKLVFYGLAGVLGLLGIIFVAGSQGQILRIVVGVILFAAAGGLIYLAQQQPQKTEVVQRIELGGDVNLQELRCTSCGGVLTDKDLRVEAGAVFVNCSYCGATYQLEEEVKW